MNPLRAMISGARSIRTILLTAVLTTLAAGCSSYSAPGLRLSDVRIADRTDAGIVLDLSIEATNRNSVELPLREMRYSMSLDGREVFRGLRSPEASLRRLGTQTIHIPVVIPAADVPAGPGPSRYVLDGKLGYITPGQFAQVLFDIKVRRPSVGFRDEGSLDLQATAP